MPKQDQPIITIADLYPHLRPEEQEQAEYCLKCYLEVVQRIFERKVHAGAMAC